MNAIKDRASVAPATVTRYSQGKVSRPRRARQPRKGKQRLLAVDGGYAVRIDPRILAWLHEHDADFHYVEVVSPTEVIIHNNPVR